MSTLIHPRSHVPVPTWKSCTRSRLVFATLRNILHIPYTTSSHVLRPFAAGFTEPCIWLLQIRMVRNPSHAPRRYVSQGQNSFQRDCIWITEGLYVNGLLCSISGVLALARVMFVRSPQLLAGQQVSVRILSVDVVGNKMMLSMKGAKEPCSSFQS